MSKLKVEKVVSPPIRPAVKKAFKFGWARICGAQRNIPIRNDPVIFTIKVAKGMPNINGVLAKSMPAKALKIAPKNPPKPINNKVRFAEFIINT